MYKHVENMWVYDYTKRHDSVMPFFLKKKAGRVQPVLWELVLKYNVCAAVDGVVA